MAAQYDDDGEFCTLTFPGIDKPEQKDKNMASEPVHYHLRAHILDRNVQKLVRHGCSHGTTDKSSSIRLLQKKQIGDVSNPFVRACVIAFNSHLPLTLRPQFFWLTITQAIALHVQQNAEELREKFVMHEGKKDIKLDVTGEVSSGFTERHWQGVVGRFEEKLKKVTIEGVTERLACSDFSDSTDAENIASMMTCMDVLKSYFNYKMSTKCGFPSITLEGTLDDWKLLKTKAEDVIKYSTLPEFSSTWLPPVLDILERLIQARKGVTDFDFWDSFVKVDGTRGSGARTWVNGWINVFFPLADKGKPNPFCKKYDDKGHIEAPKGEGKKRRPIQQGLETRDFPNGLSSCPVTLDEHLLDFQSGFLGVEQDEMGGVKPTVGWLIASGACPRSGQHANPDIKQATVIKTYCGVEIPLLDFVRPPRGF